MENKLDKLFRDKLEQHAVAPSAHAWEKVKAASHSSTPVRPEGEPERGTSNASIVWSLRIAAAVAVLAVAGWFAFDFREGLTAEVTSDKTVKQNQKKVEKPLEESAGQQVTEEKTKTESPAPVQTTVARAKAQPTPGKKTTIEKSKPEIMVKKTQPEATLASVEEVTEPLATQEMVAQPKAKAMVIVYNLAPVETRQEVEPAKTNTLKRVLEFAKDVKSGESTTFASVRNWKDNLFGSEEMTRVDNKQNN